MMLIRALAVSSALAFSASAFAIDPIASAKEEYSYFSCAEILADRERIQGRLNQIDLVGVRRTRGEVDMAVAKTLVFWPVMLFSNDAEHLSETEPLRRVLSLQDEVLAERKCTSENMTVSKGFDTSDSKVVQSQGVSDEAYEMALTEFESGELVKSLWAKSIALSDGSEFSAKANYIKLRAEQLSLEKRK